MWARPGLSPRDRSLITVATLSALGRTDQLRSHLGLALDNGVTQDELSELATHLAFYAGWPAGMTTASVLKQVLDAR
ncbi:Carboxymuconolactone decarboxylase family protein [compost metagenome]